MKEKSKKKVRLVRAYSMDYKEAAGNRGHPPASLGIHWCPPNEPRLVPGFG